MLLKYQPRSRADYIIVASHALDYVVETLRGLHIHYGYEVLVPGDLEDLIYPVILDKLISYLLGIGVDVDAYL